MAQKEMKTIQFPNSQDIYEIVDGKARKEKLNIIDLATINGKKLNEGGDIKLETGETINEGLIIKDYSENTISLKVKRKSGIIENEDITPALATAEVPGLITGNQKQILDIFRPYGDPEISVKWETDKFLEYNPATRNIKNKPWATCIDEISTMKTGFRYYVEGSNHYFNYLGEELPNTHKITDYLKDPCLNYPVLPIPEGVNSIFMGCPRNTYPSVGQLKIGSIFLLDNTGKVIYWYFLNRETNEGEAVTQTFTMKINDTVGSYKPYTIEQTSQILDGALIEIPSDAKYITVGDFGRTGIVNTQGLFYFYFGRSFKKSDNFISDNLKVDKSNVIGMPGDELDYESCEVVEIPFNYLTDWEYPAGTSVENITAGTKIWTKPFPFDYGKIQPYKLFITLTRTIDTSTLPNVEFLDADKVLISSTTGGNYTKEINLLIKGYYGVLRDIPTNTKYIRFGMNVLTKSYLRILYLKNKPTVKLKKQHTYSFTNQVNLMFGDSIIGNFEEKKYVQASIPMFLSEKLKTPFLNIGFGGCRMSQRDDIWNAYSMTTLVDSICAKDFSVQQKAIDEGAATQQVPNFAQEHIDNIKNLDFSTVGLITIAYGINDFHSRTPLGVVDTNPYNKKPEAFDVTTFAGATQYVISKLQYYYPNIRICLCSLKRNFLPNPLKEVVYKRELPASGDTKTRYWVKEEFKTYLWDGLKYIPYSEDKAPTWYRDESTSPNWEEKTILDFNNVLKQIADIYGLDYIDNMNIGITQYNAHKFYKFSDGTHPDQHGRYMVAQNIASYLTSHDFND